MNRAVQAAWLLLAVAAVARAEQGVQSLAAVLPKAQSDYLLSCGGCHGENGISNARRVPPLRAQVGFYLATPEGRAYLIRLPNVAFAALSDRELAAVLNFTVFRLGEGSVPADAAPYTIAEVRHWRSRPLNEVSLAAYRGRLVDELVAKHRAPLSLREYDAAP